MTTDNLVRLDKAAKEYDISVKGFAAKIAEKHPQAAYVEREALNELLQGRGTRGRGISTDSAAYKAFVSSLPDTMSADEKEAIYKKYVANRPKPKKAAGTKRST